MDQDIDKFVELAFGGDGDSQPTGNQNFSFDDGDSGGNTDINYFDYDEVEKELLKKAEELENNNKDKNKKIESSDEEEESQDDDADKDEEEEKEEIEINEDQSDLFLSYLSSEKIIEIPEGFEKSGDVKQDLQALLDIKLENLEKEARDNFLSNLPQDYLLAVKFALANPNKTLSDYADHYNAKVSATAGELDLENISLEEQEDQIKLYETYLKLTTKYTPDKIKKQIKILSDSGELYMEAKEALTELLAIEAQAKIDFEAAQDKLAKEKVEQERTFRKELSSILEKDTDLGAERRNKIQALVTNKITLENGVQTNPFWHTLFKLSNNTEHLVQLADLLVDYTPEKGIDLQRLISLGKKQQLADTQKKIDSAAGSRKPSGSSRRPKTTQFDWEKWALGEL